MGATRAPALHELSQAALSMCALQRDRRCPVFLHVVQDPAVPVTHLLLAQQGPSLLLSPATSILARSPALAPSRPASLCRVAAQRKREERKRRRAADEAKQAAEDAAKAAKDAAEAKKAASKRAKKAPAESPAVKEVGTVQPQPCWVHARMCHLSDRSSIMQAAPDNIRVCVCCAARCTVQSIGHYGPHCSRCWLFTLV